jgi:phosphohistidine swiveling domain-containing protein
MISKKFFAEFDTDNWQRINMRRVEHLVGAEMLHNLYSRHWPRINSIRFRNTYTYFENGLVESYAPKCEWDYLQRVLSLRFKKLDPILIREIEAILNPSYQLVDELVNKLAETDLSSTSDEDLAILILDIIDIPLGEIYKLNVVQIEYGLTKALNDILTDYEPNPIDRSDLLSRLIAPGIMTIAQQEELEIDKLRSLMRKLEVKDPMENKKTKDVFKGIVEAWASKHCAYGELPPTTEEYRKKVVFLESIGSTIQGSNEAISMTMHQLNESNKLLVKLDDEKLNLLCPLMARIGTFRDANKAKLGETMPYRHAIIEEIRRRKNLSTEEARCYLKSEFVNLLLEDSRVDLSEIKTRTKNGVHFVRTEYMDETAHKPKMTSSGNNYGSNIHKGICASSGSAKGRVVIVNGKEDIHKVEEGDIMVAIGTDFDVLEAMYRSAAIITEEGGLLSHASVVSRELGKPCLIGVSNATKVLTPGSKVMVESTKGYLEVIL